MSHMYPVRRGYILLGIEDRCNVYGYPEYRYVADMVDTASC